MTEKELIGLLRRWDLAVEESAPEEDPRRTPDCLRWDEIHAIAQNSSATPHPALLEKWAHIDGCVWCTRAISEMAAEMEKVREEQAEAEREAIYNSSDPRFRYPVARGSLSGSAASSPFMEGVSGWISAWLRRKSLPMDASTSAYFDAEGTLHIERAVQNLSGEVRLSLLVDGVPMPLGSARVEQGSIHYEQAMPEWNVRSMRLPDELISVLPG